MPSTRLACSVSSPTTATARSGRAGSTTRRERGRPAVIDSSNAERTSRRTSRCSTLPATDTTMSPRLVAPGVVAVHLATGQPGDRVHAAEDRPSQRGVAVQGRGELVEHEIGGVVVAHRDLFEDHAALDVDVLRGHRRMQHHVADDVDGEREITVEDGRVEAGVLLLGERVELAADGVHLDRDVEGAAAPGALEQQVFEEVAGAGQRGRLVARADRHPHADAHAADAGHRLGDHAQSARHDRAGDGTATGGVEPSGHGTGGAHSPDPRGAATGAGTRATECPLR